MSKDSRAISDPFVVYGASVLSPGGLIGLGGLSTEGDTQKQPEIRFDLTRRQVLATVSGAGLVNLGRQLLAVVGGITSVFGVNSNGTAFEEGLPRCKVKVLSTRGQNEQTTDGSHEGINH